MRPPAAKLWRYAAAFLTTMALLIPAHTNAAARTYKPMVEDSTPQMELCRLKKREYTDGGTNCIYARQTGGKDALIRVDDAKVRCQAEYHCKRLK